MELAPEIGDLNLFGANFTEYGLPGLGDVAYGLVMQELESRRFGRPQHGLGAELPRHVPRS